jgi:lipopolysaccharide transport system ATP-binding protein
MALLSTEALSVSFPLYHGSARSLRKTMADAAYGRLGHDPRRRIVVEALRDVSFTLRPGDRLGLIGGNGAGKTTLLRSLAGIYEPVRGRVRIEGELNALLDPSSGMNPALTGRENIVLRCQYAGLGRQAIQRVAEDVRVFAELGDFLEMPVRTYSSGMSIRLGFALATAIRPQVLLMDEWFLAGDTNFMHKARDRLESLVKQAEIMVLSTHQLDIIAAWCTHGLWLEDGRVRMLGPVQDVLSAYSGGAVTAKQDMAIGMAEEASA